MTRDASVGDDVPIELGETVYNDDGDALGVINRFSTEGFEVSITDDDDVADEQEHEPGKEFGEGYLVWRCDDCGEVGELEGGFPDECPSCGAPKNALVRKQED